MVIAKLNYLKIAPRKVRMVADLIRGKSVEEAGAILNFTIKGAAKPMGKLLASAVANAKHNFQLDAINLYISKITVDEGPKQKRWRARARGRAAAIQKKSSHITIILDEKKAVEKIKTISAKKAKTNFADLKKKARRKSVSPSGKKETKKNNQLKNNTKKRELKRKSF